MQLPSGPRENAHIKYVYSYLSQEFGKVSSSAPSCRRRPARETASRDGKRPAPLLVDVHGEPDEPRPTAAPSTRTCRSTKTATSPSRSRQPRRGRQTRCPSAVSPGCPGGRTRRGSSSCATCCPAPDSRRRSKTPSQGPSSRRWAPTTRGRYYATPGDFERQVGCHPPQVRSSRRQRGTRTQEAPQAQEEAPEKASRLEP